MSSVAHKNKELLAAIARESGIAVVLVDRDGREVAGENNSSICRSLMASPALSLRCAADCGKAFERVHASGEAIEYECHAGLMCRAVPSDTADRQLVAIVGRVFTKAENYRRATERAISGEWSEFAPTEFFENVLITGSTDVLETAADQLYSFIPATSEAAEPELEVKERTETPAEIDRGLNASETAPNIPQITGADSTEEIKKAARLRSLFGSLLGTDHAKACELVIRFVSEEFGVDSVAWLETTNGTFHAVAATGDFGGRELNANIAAESGVMLTAATEGNPIELRERRDGMIKPGRVLLFFPIRVGEEIRSAIGVGIESEHDIDRREIARIARSVGPQIEILRLRSELKRNTNLAAGVKRLNDILMRIDSEDFCIQVTRTTAEILRSERASLLIRDENTGQLDVKAAIGSAVDLSRTEGIGLRIARKIADSGESLIVRDLEMANIASAPLEWRYKTSSFISYPISIGEKRLGVMNFTDRADGSPFSERDVEFLRSIAPQIAVALDHRKLKARAGELEKRSITDSLTGLMNRGYIEERLIEEINRASRYRFPMSLLMIDVDHFKSYNDSYGHPAGDVALRLVASVLKRTLRAADVAARYGGEEFAVLLPQTPVEEATSIAERIRQRVERSDFPKRQVTISVGVAGFSSEFTEPKDWITAADMALYEAKETGRNRVIRYEDMGRSFREKIH